MISVKNLGFVYQGGKSAALDGINIEIADGDFVGITGTSGAGKTTFTFALSGIIPQKIKGDFFGAVTVDGVDTAEHPAEDFARKVGQVFQDIDSQMVASVVEDEILFGLENFGVPHEEIAKRVDRVLKDLGIEDLRDREIEGLSGGQKQKVAIASILALEPEVIVLDEPTGELDPESSREIFKILTDLNREKGITVIIVEQKIMLLCEYVKHMMVLDKGKIAFYGTPGDMAASIDTFKDLGINVPRVTELSAQLISEKIYDGEVTLTVDDAEKMVRRILK
ncbi:MAG: ATP-binding cassette domain-containing protein [Butyrivibrio sp.]|nr:ATP-binding cassette domain-containing protein [Butyrivibrio sp.]MBR1641264.1 ATP-binding cassette domain-containing protein [Butyrivibrio sp.]